MFILKTKTYLENRSWFQYAKRTVSWEWVKIESLVSGIVNLERVPGMIY